jgi:hypothetical protein
MATHAGDAWDQIATTRMRSERKDAVAAFVRVSGPPNSNFLVGYPGISATLVRDVSRAMEYRGEP